MTWGGQGMANGQFRLPSGVAASGDSLYVSDTENQRVQRFSSSGVWQMTWGGQGSGSGQLHYPWGMAAGPGGYVYVADTTNDRIQRFRGDGSSPLPWGSLGSGNGQFDTPYGVAVGGDGGVYAADTGNHRIQKFNGDGVWQATWGVPGSGPGQLNYPHGVAAGGGAVYVADTGNDRVQKFDAAGAWQASWGASGSGPGEFRSPDALAVDGAGNIYVADTGNDRIQKLKSGGAWLAAWGDRGSGDGQLRGPRGVAVDGSGRVYVADSGNNRIQVFRPMTYTRPIATITHISNASLASDETLIAHGRGQDSDETPAIAAYRWSVDGRTLGVSATLSISATALGYGDHLLTLEVQDSEGQWSEPVSTPVFAATPSQIGWTMLLYLAADSSDRGQLLHAFERMLNRLRVSFHNPDVRIAVQLDGPADGDTRRILITPGDGIGMAHVAEIPYGEQAMDDPAVLAGFVRWGQGHFPAAHYYLAIADHGQGIQGIGWDETSAPGGAYLTGKELGQALGATAVAPIDIVHLDASSMNLLETAYEVRQQTRILIASQYLAWNYFAYDGYQNAMHATATARDVALGITASYAARAQADHLPFTIAALDMQRAEPALSAVDELAAELVGLVDNDGGARAQLDAIWRESRKFESSGDYLNTAEDMYVDLADWAGRVEATMSSPAVRERAAALLRELNGPQAFIIAGSNHIGSNALPPQYAGGAYINLSGSSGLSIFYPLRRDTVVFNDYVKDRLFSFTSASRWPDFLTAGVAPLPGPLAPPPGPLPPLPAPYDLFLPLTRR
jgi:DNA-binding beta-propeller fold protein YncE